MPGQVMPVPGRPPFAAIILSLPGFVRSPDCLLFYFWVAIFGISSRLDVLMVIMWFPHNKHPSWRETQRDRDGQAGLWVLDGGMGRELARRGAPFRQPEWSALALMEAPRRCARYTRPMRRAVPG